MIVSVEISYYPLTEDFNAPIELFIKKINSKDVTIKTGKMSTLLTGEYSHVMKLLMDGMDAMMQEYPSVFNIKISNSCIL